MKNVDKILNLENKYKVMTNEELQQASLKIKEMIRKDNSNIEKMICNVYALVRESAYRVLGMKPYKVQIMGALEIHSGKIVEMKTGEGKTLTITMPTILNAYTGKGVHVITVNDYLAERDCEEMSALYDFLGLTSGFVISKMSPSERKIAYSKDITYGTNKEFGFDYLRDNMAKDKNGIVQIKGLNYAIIDEVDSILIDEARTPLIIANIEGSGSDFVYKYIDAFTKSLKRGRDKKIKIEGDELFEKEAYKELTEHESEILGDYTIDERKKSITLTKNGFGKAKEFFSMDIKDEPQLIHYIQNSLKANYIMVKDENYIVKNGKVMLVDESTNRVLEGRQYSDGLHQAIQAKEEVEIDETTQTLASITLQNYFRLYNKISGMSGTVCSEKKEFKKIYGLKTVVIPTNKPVIRKDKKDILFQTEEEKFDYVVNLIEKENPVRPILIGTSSIDKSEMLYEKIINSPISEGRKISILNAKNDADEAKIVAQAGMPYSITISTNMAGRGTDILLGGDAKGLAIEELKKHGMTKSEEELLKRRKASKEIMDKYNEYYNEFKKETDLNKKEVLKSGGLFVIGTERHESQRIDNQLRGRAGRQGDPGKSIFLVSAEDNIMKMFGFNKDTKITHRLVKIAQSTVESKNYEQRKNIVEYDDIISDQRNIIYEMRRDILMNKNLNLDAIVKRESMQEEYENLQRIAYYCRSNDIDYDEIKCRVALDSIDKNWVAFLIESQGLREVVAVNNFSVIKPINRYKASACKLYDDFLKDIRRDIISNLSSIKVELPVVVDVSEERI